MKNYLAFDTSSEQLSVVLKTAEQVFAEHIYAGQNHTSLILPLIRKFLNQAKLSMKDIDGIAVGIGPGSFTGVRIACGIAQGLAFPHNIPVVGINTLLALAEKSETGKALCCIDARMNEVYFAAYQRQNSEWQEIYPPCLKKPADLPDVWGVDWMGLGSGWQVYREALDEKYKDNLKAIEMAYPSAQAILNLALPQFQQGQGKPAQEILPLYLRDQVAHVKVQNTTHT